MLNTTLPLTHHMAKQFRELYFGGNWTGVDLKATLENVTWKQATTQAHKFNTIAALVYHIDYYVRAVTGVLTGQTLGAHDRDSFNSPPIQSQEDWVALLKEAWSSAETFANAVEALPPAMLEKDFFQNKYGTYFRNISGVIEHTHYHLGQIVLIKKIIGT